MAHVETLTWNLSFLMSSAVIERALANGNVPFLSPWLVKIISAKLASSWCGARVGRPTETHYVCTAAGAICEYICLLAAGTTCSAADGSAVPNVVRFDKLPPNVNNKVEFIVNLCR